MKQHSKRPLNKPVLIGLFLTACALAHSCATESALFGNLAATSSFSAPSGALANRAMQVGFINNTPFRAIFTFGAYNPLDEETIPSSFGQLRLEGNSSSPQAAQPCRKTFAVGGEELVRLIELNRENPGINITDERALVRGVNFSSAPLGDPLEAEPTEGTAQQLVVTAGNDFTCERTDIRQTIGTGLLLFTFEQDAAAPGGFRIDFTFIAP